MSKGEIQLITGCMYAGKTSEMFLRVQRQAHAGRHPLIIRFAGDNRYNETDEGDQEEEEARAAMATSHDRYTMVAVSVDANGLTTEIPGLDKAGVVGIDEGQFYDNLAPFCDALANDGKVVIVAALDSTWERKPFPQVSQLYSVADTVDKLKGVCIVCSGEASFSRRITSSTELVDVGGDDKYICVCRSCFDVPIEQEKLDKRKQSVELILKMRSGQ